MARTRKRLQTNQNEIQTKQNEIAAENAIEKQTTLPNAAVIAFDYDERFGPFVGVTRLLRWQRAERFGLRPPKGEVLRWLHAHPHSQPFVAFS